MPCTGTGSGTNGRPRIVATYDYTDEAGQLLFQVVRKEPGRDGRKKDFVQRRPDGRGGWIWKKGTRLVLYRLPQLLAADPSRPVFVVEGEKDADSLHALGLVATTNPMGADAGTGEKKWLPEFSESLRDRAVVLTPDNDDSGRKHVQTVARSLAGIARHIAILELPGLPEKGDVSDWLTISGNDKEKLLRLALDAPEWEAPEIRDRTGPNPSVGLEPPTWEPEGPPAWPDPPAAEAFHGLPGRIVRTIEPSSEADPAALLVQALVAFGSVIGRSAFFAVEADKHRANEFAVLVGRTSKARKGTSWGRVYRLFQEAEEQWAAERVQTGLSSGEGLIWAVRDPIKKRERIKERGQPVKYEEVEADAGVQDKRLLVYEPEYANVLKQTERQGNTLSAILRQAWDGGNLRTLTKNSPACATDAHVSMIGHITADELRRYLTATETANGYGNRHLWICADRSKLLPEGGRVDPAAWDALRSELAEALAFGRSVGEIHRDEEARTIWREIYGELSEGKPGLAGALLARGEAHVTRLALLYALMDRSAEIQAVHLLAALALWDYCTRSVYFVFGDELGDPLADDLLRLLRASPQGLTRNEIRDYLGRNQPSSRIGQALGLLLQHRLARQDRQQTEGRGRPAERWFATRGRELPRNGSGETSG